jgi:hypothetical protein
LLIKERSHAVHRINFMGSPGKRCGSLKRLHSRPEFPGI